MAGQNVRKNIERSEGLSALMKTDYGKVVQHFTMIFALAFSIPFESWFRYDFGERYYSWGSYVSAAITMILWFLIMGWLNGLLLGGFSSIMISEDPGAPEGMISGFLYAFFKLVTFQNFSTYDLYAGLFYIIWLGHVFLGLYHFYRMWYRSRTGQALHSYDPGNSRLKFLSRLVFKPVNLVLNSLVKSLAFTIPSALRKDEARLTPFFNQPDLFTKLYLEPFIVFFIGVCFVWNGWGLLAIYFMLGAVGMAHITRLQFVSMEAQILDLRDQFIDQTSMVYVDELANTHAYSGSKEQSQRTQNTAFQLAKMANKRPEIIDQVKKENPSLFDMMEELDPNFKAMAGNDNDKNSNINT